MTSQPAPLPGEILYGSSFRLANGDLVLDGNHPDGEPQLVRGLVNLEQALTLRLLTPFGSDPVNTGYGLDVRSAFTGGRDRRTVKELIRLEVVRTLGSDRRVREVTEVLFDDDPQFTARVLAAGRHPAGHRTRLWQVLVTVETIQDVTTSVLVDVEF